VAVAGIFLQEPGADQVINALRKGGSAGACCHQQWCLTAWNAIVQACQDW
jgi:hypothetical protein